eukprot:9031633-Pyramimonas_sp.AAC.1
MSTIKPPKTEPVVRCKSIRRGLTTPYSLQVLLRGGGGENDLYVQEPAARPMTAPSAGRPRGIHALSCSARTGSRGDLSALIVGLPRNELSCIVLMASRTLPSSIGKGFEGTKLALPLILITTIQPVRVKRNTRRDTYPLLCGCPNVWKNLA